MTTDEMKRKIEAYYDEAAEALGLQPYALLSSAKQRCIEHVAVWLMKELRDEFVKAIEGAP